jgi:hypothetical protein
MGTIGRLAKPQVNHVFVTRFTNFGPSGALHGAPRVRFAGFPVAER